MTPSLNLVCFLQYLWKGRRDRHFIRQVITMTRYLEQKNKPKELIDLPSDLNQYDFVWEEELLRQEIRRRRWERRPVSDRQVDPE